MIIHGLFCEGEEEEHEEHVKVYFTPLLHSVSKYSGMVLGEKECETVDFAHGVQSRDLVLRP